MINEPEMHPVTEALNDSEILESDGLDNMSEVIPPRPKRRRPRKHKFVAGLLAVLIPGTGHLYLGLLRKGISLIFIILLDIAALLYFSSIGMQINVPLLILLALLIPVLYFYNVFDVLQTSDRILNLLNHNGAKDEGGVDSDLNPASPVSKRRSLVSEPGISFGLLLLFGGALLIMFRQKPVWLQAYIEHYAGVTVAALLICIGVLLGVREIAKRISKRGGSGSLNIYRIGRFTAVLLLISVGVLLLLDWKDHTENMLLLLKWWPVVPVLWGIEYLLMYFSTRRADYGTSHPGKKFRLDVSGVITAVVISVSVFIVAEQEHYIHLWNRVNLNLTAAAVDYGEATGTKYQKPTLIVPVELKSAKLTIDAINGDILLHRAPVEDIEIVATVWVDQLEGVMAEAISEQSFIEVAEGSNIKITPKGKAYGESGKRQPRIDMDILVPEDRRFNLQVRTMNGGITLQNVEAIEDISLETGNGELILHKVYGDITGKTLNGAVRVRDVQGSVDLSTSGGDMNAWDIAGSLKLSTAVGNVATVNSGGTVDIVSKNGNLTVTEARMKVHAESLNGSINVRSSQIGGDWDIYSAVGDLDLFLPLVGSYSVEGSSGYGDISSDIPELFIDKKTVSGKVGTGEYKLHLEGNSNLNVRKY
ncbi:DUF4097 family beta strand repeat-containing protein [Paenibacillus wynnii]|uniref:DUF4097 family beta strand repeat-containing protein n=1 Tax=Paenibacillus wynnii TaxID=268407 RepID=UPI000A5B592D|nr:DUF4097 family beta strand repeat-containing protein [Paenibacillus wynnii]